MIRAVKRGLVLHFLFFKNEIRDFDAIVKGEDIKLPSEQLELGRGLIEKMSAADFEPERYAEDLENAEGWDDEESEEPPDSGM